MFVDALATACPQVDSSQLAMDIDPNGVSDSARAEIWLTEMTPGGTGQIEQLHATLAREPGQVRSYPGGLGRPGGHRGTRPVAAPVHRIVGADGRTGEAAERLRAVLAAPGMQAVNSALDELRATAAVRGLELSRLAWTAISTRLLGAGAHPDLPTALTSWLRTWDEAEARACVVLDLQVAGVLVAESEDVAAVLNLPPDATGRHRSRAVANVLWPRGSTAWQDGADAASTFGPFPEPDIALIRSALGAAPVPLTVSDWNDDVRRQVHQVLLRESRAVLRFPITHVRDARRAVLSSQTDPIDVGSMLGYPSVVSVRQDARPR